MPTVLDKIVATKRTEIVRARAAVPEEELQAQLADAPPVRDFFSALAAGPPIRLIAEVKKAIRQFVYNLNVPARWGQSPFTNITLDIVVPVYNEEKGVEGVLERLAKLELGAPVEILAVNDGSKDGTAAALASIVRRIPNLRVVTHAADELDDGPVALVGVAVGFERTLGELRFHRGREVLEGLGTPTLLEGEGQPEEVVPREGFEDLEVVSREGPRRSGLREAEPGIHRELLALGLRRGDGSREGFLEPGVVEIHDGSFPWNVQGLRPQ